MAPMQAPTGVSVPRPSDALTSYSTPPRSASGVRHSQAEISDLSPSTRVGLAAIGQALVSTACNSARPLTAGELVASAGLSRWVDGPTADEVLGELVAAGRLARGHRWNSLFERVVVYSAPHAAG